LQSPTQWDDIYYRLSSSDFKDSRWSCKNFGLQKVADVKSALKWVESHDTTRYNINSIATAKLGAVVVGALGGKKAKVHPQDFLPFDPKDIKTNSGPTDETVITIGKLLKEGKLPTRVIGLLSDEIKRSTTRK
jgi:hypothetical protein